VRLFFDADRGDNRPYPSTRRVPALMLALAGAWMPFDSFSETPEGGVPPGTKAEDVAPVEKAPANPPEVAEPASPYGSLKWDYSPLGVYGPTFTSPDKQNRLTVGLFVWFDNSFVLDDKEFAEALGRDEIDGESRIATARLEFNGSYTEDYWYYFRVDFQDNGSGSGDSAVEWAALGFNNLPVVQNLLVGLQMPTYGLDVWANYPRHRLMLEPSLVNAFFHGPLLGITAYDVDMDHKLSWALGIARDTTEEAGSGLQAVDKGEDDYIVHGRFSFLPRYSELGRHMIHLGVSGALIKPQDETLVWGIWPEVYTDDVELYPLAIIDNAKKAMLGVLEFRYVEGPFWMQSDYFYNKTQRDTADDLTFSAFYVEAGYFLTGHQTLFSPLAINGQVLPVPITNRKLGQWGAWEIQARYSQLDLRSKEFQGGATALGDGAEVTNYTLGLNWFLNQHIKIGINYVHSVREDLDDAKFDVIQTRLAWTL
jgi:phosphate-selective porin OprO/OprP